MFFYFFFQAEDGIRDLTVTGVQTCALPICPVGFVASPKWKPRTDVYETDQELIVHMDIAGMQAGDFKVELDEGILKVAGERTPRQQGRRHYHAMEVQVGPFERRFRLPVVVDPSSIRATYEHGFLEIRLAKQPPDRKSIRLNSSHSQI